MNLQFKWEWLPLLLNGTVVTLELTACCIAIGFFLGILLAIARVYGNRLIYALATAYVEFFRGTPLLVQLYIFYFGFAFYGVRFSSFIAAILGLGLNSAAYQAEYFRGAIQSIKAGQMMAARSIGMSRTKAIRYIILPQALRIVIPPWSNELIYMVKYSSLAYFIGTTELFNRGLIIASKNFRYFEVLIVVALIYLVLVFIIAKLLDILEKRVRIPGLEMKL